MPTRSENVNLIEYKPLQQRAVKVLIEIVRLANYAIGDGQIPDATELSKGRFRPKLNEEQARQKLRRFRQKGYFVKRDEKELLNPSLCTKSQSAQFLLNTKDIILTEAIGDIKPDLLIEKLYGKGFVDAGELLDIGIEAGYLQNDGSSGVKIGLLLRYHLPYLKSLAKLQFV